MSNMDAGERIILEVTLKKQGLWDRIFHPHKEVRIAIKFVEEPLPQVKIDGVTDNCYAHILLWEGKKSGPRKG